MFTTSRKNFIIITITTTTIMMNMHSAFNVTGNSWRRRQEGLADQLVEQVTSALYNVHVH